MAEWYDGLGLPDLGSWAKNIGKGTTKNGGTVIVLYNQTLDSRVDSGSSVVSEGWCLAMCIKWIGMTACDKSFWEWFHPPAIACPSMRDRHAGGAAGPVYVVLHDLMATQMKAKEGMSKLGSLGVFDTLRLKYGWISAKLNQDTGAKCVPIGLLPRLIRVSTGEQLAGHIILSPGFKLISMTSTTTAGGHAIACRVIDGSVVVMDPNYGEFFFPDYAGFSKFFNSFWRISKYERDYTHVIINSYTDPAGSFGHVSF